MSKKETKAQMEQRLLDEKFRDAVCNIEQEKSEALLAQGANINSFDKDGHNLLMFATSNGDRDWIDLILYLGASISCANERGETPLTLAKDDETRQFTMDKFSEYVKEKAEELKPASVLKTKFTKGSAVKLKGDIQEKESCA